MTQVTLLAQNGTAGTVGSSTLIGQTSTGVQNLQFNPQPGVGFTGTIEIDGSDAPNPASTDWSPLATVICSAQTGNFVIAMTNSMPWIRAQVIAGTVGAVSVYASY